ncbi:unnamed protein product [Closterium sp. Naga37s-1]|nr:unnamed protein product [Closterium sp. Naga37s-1]
MSARAWRNGVAAEAAAERCRQCAGEKVGAKAETVAMERRLSARAVLAGAGRWHTEAAEHGGSSFTLPPAAPPAAMQQQLSGSQAGGGQQPQLVVNWSRNSSVWRAAAALLTPVGR